MAQKWDGSVEITIRHAGNVVTYELTGADIDAVEESYAFDASALFPDRPGQADATTLRINGISTGGRFVSAVIEVTTPPTQAWDTSPPPVPDVPKSMPRNPVA